jgi:hypothetical protein
MMAKIIQPRLRRGLGGGDMMTGGDVSGGGAPGEENELSIATGNYFNLRKGARRIGELICD